MIKMALMLKPTLTALEHYRQITPHTLLQTMDRDFQIEAIKGDGTIDSVTDEDLSKYQAIQYIRIINTSSEKTKADIDRLHNLGLKVIFDIDDYWTLDSDHAISKQMKDAKYEQSTITALENVDWVTTTSDYFAEQIRPYNSNVSVLPNCIDPFIDKQWERREIASERVRFGWVGGVFHSNDFDLFAPSIKKLSSTFGGLNKDLFQLALCGYNTAGLTGEQVRFYKANRTRTFNVKQGSGPAQNVTTQELMPEYVVMEEKITDKFKMINYDKAYREYLDEYTPTMEHVSYDKPYRRIWSRPVENYGGVYNEIDVALVPLRNTKFNRCKSELKLVEAGTMGKAVIVSDVYPYNEVIEHGVNGLLVKSPNDWFMHIRKLTLDKEYRLELAKNLEETIKDKFDAVKIQSQRGMIYKKLVA